MRYFDTLRIVTVATIVTVMTAMTGCQLNPATGQSNFNVLSEQQEIALGQESEPDFIQAYGGEIPSPQVRNYVSNLGQALAQQSERPGLPWTFHALDSDVINAFALPGGKVFITRGLMTKLSSEAELAGVLGHEIGHVTAQHIGQQMSQQIAIQIGLAGIGVATQASNKDWVKVLGVGAQAGGTLYTLSFGRGQETQADELGLRYMTRLGYNPVGQIRVMEALQKASGGGGGGPEFLATHPYPETRINHLNELVRKEYPGYDQPGKYKFEPDAYRVNVLEPLKKLPAAKHKG